MQKKIIFCFIFLVFIPCALFAEGAAVNAGQKEKAVLAPEVIAKELPAYTQSLKQIVKQAQENLKKIDAQLAKEQASKAKLEAKPTNDAIAAARDFAMEECLRRQEKKAQKHWGWF